MADVIFWATGNIWKYVCLSKEGAKVKKIEKGKRIKEVPSLEQIEQSLGNLRKKLRDEFSKLKELIGDRNKRTQRKEKEEVIVNLRNKIRLLEEYQRVKKNPII